MPSPPKPQITIVFTGGTISMGFDPAVGGVVPILSPDQILAQVPDLETIAEIEVIDFARIPGPHMSPARMLELARVVETQLSKERVAGVVVTHGTDTLEE